ncbi:Ankyrin repeat domain-containing protein 39 [Mycena kentingensis (nom. inval.)]|nr:Ankyrin repeat domain-containing protein 39 [Mycena kentingensis (nom. inval.)]
MNPSQSDAPPSTSNSPTESLVERDASPALDRESDLGFGSECNDSIFVAAQRGDVAAIRNLLISGKAAVTDRNSGECTALHLAVISGQVAACRVLLEHGAQVNAVEGAMLATPMHLAGNLTTRIEIIRLLVAYGADPSITDARGHNLLHVLAAFFGRPAHGDIILKYLLETPLVNVQTLDARSAAGHTALMLAAVNRRPARVQMLLEHGASTSAVDGKEMSALHYAAKGGDPACMRLLIENGADIDARDHEGSTPGHWAHKGGSFTIWERVVKASRLTIVVDPLTPLMRSALLGDVHRVHLLLQHGASPTAVDDWGMTPLHWAVLGGRAGCISVLIENGTIIGARDNKGWTARDLAQLRVFVAWRNALIDLGLDDDKVQQLELAHAQAISKRQDRLIRTAIVASLVLVSFLALRALVVLPWYLRIVIDVAELLGLANLGIRILRNSLAAQNKEITKAVIFAYVSTAWALLSGFTKLTYHVPQAPGPGLVAYAAFPIACTLFIFNSFGVVTPPTATTVRNVTDKDLSIDDEDGWTRRGWAVDMFVPRRGGFGNFVGNHISGSGVFLVTLGPGASVRNSFNTLAAANVN